MQFFIRVMVVFASVSAAAVLAHCAPVDSSGKPAPLADGQYVGASAKTLRGEVYYSAFLAEYAPELPEQHMVVARLGEAQDPLFAAPGSPHDGGRNFLVDPFGESTVPHAATSNVVRIERQVSFFAVCDDRPHAYEFTTFHDNRPVDVTVWYQCDVNDHCSRARRCAAQLDYEARLCAASAR